MGFKHNFPTIIMYHGDNCNDGFTSAYVAWLKFGDNALYYPLDYNTNFDDNNFPDVENKEVYVLDYALPDAAYQRVMKQAKSLLQLDHHQTNLNRLQGKAGCIFDMDKSGATLSWSHFHPHTQTPAFVLDVEDYDLWKWRRPSSIPFSRGSNLLNKTFKHWDEFQNVVNYQKTLQNGSYLDSQWTAWVYLSYAQSMNITLLDRKGKAVNAHQALRSELGNLLAKKSGDFGLIWRVSDYGKIAASLRGHQREILTLAERLGGGGHKMACGLSFKSLEHMNNYIPNISDSAPTYEYLNIREYDTNNRGQQLFNNLIELNDRAEKENWCRADGRPFVAVDPELPIETKKEIYTLLVNQENVLAEEVSSTATFTNKEFNGKKIKIAHVFSDPVFALPVAHNLSKQADIVLLTYYDNLCNKKVLAAGEQDLVNHLYLPKSKKLSV